MGTGFDLHVVQGAREMVSVGAPDGVIIAAGPAPGL